MNRTFNQEQTWVVVFAFISFLFLSFVVYDRCTGTTKLVMANVTNTYHEHEVHTETHTDKNGHTTTSTHTHDYYWVYFVRKDGHSSRTDVGYWNFGTFFHGQQIVVNLTIGGASGMEYLVGITPYKGGEAL